MTAPQLPAARYAVEIDSENKAYGDDLYATVIDALALHRRHGRFWLGPAVIDFTDFHLDMEAHSTILIGQGAWSVAGLIWGSALTGPMPSPAPPRPLIIQPPDEPVDDAPIAEAVDHADVVMVLRTMLDKAERGEVAAVAVAAVLTGGKASSTYKGGNHMIELIGSVALMQHRMATETSP